MENFSGKIKRVTPIVPPAPYVGGKNYLARRIISIIEAIAHTTYAEPFLGMGGIFLKRRWQAKAEIINDVSGDVINLFRILQRHYSQFMDCLKFQITSRQEFERLLKVEPATLTDLERAARFLYLQRLSFGGKVRSPTFGIEKERSARFEITKLAPILADIHERIAGVIIENLDWHQFIMRYDSENTLFYLDPPYWGVEDYYGKEVFHRDDFAKMAEQLSQVKGSFLLSINDVKDIRTIFKAFAMSEVKVNYCLSSKKLKKTSELIITNRDEALQVLEINAPDIHKYDLFSRI